MFISEDSDLNDIIERLKEEMDLDERKLLDTFSSTIVLKHLDTSLFLSPHQGGECPANIGDNTCTRQQCQGAYTDCDGHSSHCPTQTCGEDTCNDHGCGSNTCGSKACTNVSCDNVHCVNAAYTAYENPYLGNIEVQYLMEAEIMNEGISQSW